VAQHLHTIVAPVSVEWLLKDAVWKCDVYGSNPSTEGPGVVPISDRVIVGVKRGPPMSLHS
jgi:hypothetical protein